ncbi:MAG: choice-of-anchor J domain-containing protein [Bacteroidales bacterium]|nr:choice-of-anchor J domain-containing protein [Bacteroidales bacterium]
MKKIFTLFIAILAMSICANAQILFTENFDSGMPTGWTQIDANNDGMGWEHSSNPVSYFPTGVDLTGTGHNGSTAYILSGSFTNVSQTAITPDNWLITPAINLTANSTLRFYVCAQDANYAAEHYGVFISTTNATSTTAFTMLNEWTVGSSKVQSAWEEKIVDLSAYTGQTVYIAFRHFNCNDQFLLNLDDVTITANPTTPTITANPISFSFTNIIAGNTSNAASTTVLAYNLTTDITATTTAPFEVSTDGTAFANTATLDTAGGTLYVRYAPTTAGNHTDSVVLSAAGAPNLALAVTGSSVDCSNYPFPINEDFSAELTPCWQVFNADPNNPNEAGVDQGEFVFTSYSTANDYTQYLITPELHGTSDMLLSFDYYADPSTETFMVGYSSTTSDVSAFTWSNEETATSTQATYYMSLPAGTKYVAIKYTSNYMFWFVVDNLSIIDMPTTPTFNITTTSLDFGSINNGSTKSLSFPITGLALTSDITVSTAAPFAVSADGNTYGTTATIPASTGGITNATVYVRFAPTTPGNQTGNVTLTSGTLTHTVALSGTAVDCSNSINGFWLEEFEGEVFPPSCWDLISTSEETWSRYTQDDGNSVASCSYVADNQDEKLITPLINLSGFNTPTLGFKVSTNYTYVCTGNPDETCNLQVLVSTDGGSNWSAPIFDLCNYTDEGYESWTLMPFVVDLSSYAGQSNVKLMFNYTGFDGCQIILDNVNLLDLTGVNEVSEASVNVYPNPANNTLYVNATSNISKIEVFNTLGQKVMTVSANDNHAQLNTSNLSKGMYMLKLHTDNGVVNQKFTIAR